MTTVHATENALLLNDLPNEVLITIIGSLDFREVMKCRKVCQLWRDLIATSASLRYLLELGIAGLVDNSTGGIPIAERLSALQRHQLTWYRLHWTKITSISPAGDSLYKLAGGVFARGQRRTGTGLTLTELPSSLLGTEGRVWRHDNLGVNVGDFGIDPAQDLLVLIQHREGPSSPWRFHIRELSSNNPHPLTVKPIFEHNDPEATVFTIPDTAFTIRIMGDLIAVQIISEQLEGPIFYNFLIIWQWTTGSIRAIIPVERTPIRCSSFSFLSDHTIVFPKTSQMELVEPAYAWLEVYDFEPVKQTQSTKPIAAPVLVASYYLPPLNEDVVSGSLDIRSDPAPHVVPQGPNSRRAGSTMAQSTREAFDGRTSYTRQAFLLGQDRTLVFRLKVGGVNHALMGSCFIFAHAKTLLAHTYTENKPPVHVRWENWGIRHARIISDERMDYNAVVCYIHGNRFVVSIPVGALGVSGILVFDFNPIATSRLARRASVWPTFDMTGGHTVLSTASPRNAVPSPIFEDPVVSCLSFTSMANPTPIPTPRGLMIDEERILVVKDLGVMEVEVYTM